MTKIEPLLHFNSQCEEAIEIYGKAFGAELVVLMRYSDADPKDLQYEFDDSGSEANKNLIYHAQLMIGNQKLLLCDSLKENFSKDGYIHLVITFDTEDEVKTAFTILSDSATIIEPLHKTAYCSCVGTLIDKFGIHWGVMSAV